MAEKSSKRNGKKKVATCENQRELRSRIKQSSSQRQSSSSSSSPHSSSYCLFCFKPITRTQSGDNNAEEASSYEFERLKTCELFCNQLSSSSTSSDITTSASVVDALPVPLLNKPNEKTISLFWNDQQVKTKKNLAVAASIYGACTDCFTAIKHCSDVSEQIEKLQLDLKQKLQSLYNVMKCAVKVEARVEKFKESFHPTPPLALHENKSTESNKCSKENEAAELELVVAVTRSKPEAFQLDDVLNVRKGIFRKCANRLNLKQQRVSMPGDDDKHVEIIKVIKKEVEEVTLDLHPNLYPAEDNRDDGQAHVNSFPWVGASWMNDASTCIGSIATAQFLQCEKCQQTFATDDDLAWHEKNGCCSTDANEETENTKNVEKLASQVCNSFSEQVSVGLDLINVRSIEDETKDKIKYHVCKVCRKKFQHRHTLVDHLRTHSKEKPFTCLFCDSMYTRKHSLVRHFKMAHYSKVIN